MLRSSHRSIALLVVGLLFSTNLVLGQEPNKPSPQAITTKGHPPSLKDVGSPHKFWDGENIALFAGVATVRALDFTSTQHFRERGVNEVLLTNGIVDNKPLFAGIELAGTAASVGVSYLLHRTGHHRLERWVSAAHIGVATFGDIRNYGLSNPQFTGTAK